MLGQPSQLPNDGVDYLVMVSISVAKNTQADPRYVRVRRKLQDAVLELAKATPVEEVSVAQLSSAAGVHRTSFYSHAASPAELLVDAVVDEVAEDVDALFDRLRNTDQECAVYWQDFYRLALAHVDKRAAVYEQAVAANSALLTGLYEFYLGSVERALGEISGFWAPPKPSDLWLNMAAEQQAHSLIAVITAWVNDGRKATIDEVVAEYWTLAPPWQLAKRDEDGLIHMAKRGGPVLQRDAT